MKKKYLLLATAPLVLLTAVAIWHRKTISQNQEFPILNTVGKSPLVKNIKTFTNQGGRVDWSHNNNLIAFDRKDEDGYYDVWVMKPDGTEQKCLTCDKPQLPNKNIGQPAWHPSGKYI